MDILFNMEDVMSERIFGFVERALQYFERSTLALEQIANHLHGLRKEGIVVWGGVEPEEN